MAGMYPAEPKLEATCVGPQQRPPNAPSGSREGLTRRGSLGCERGQARAHSANEFKIKTVIRV